jgi:hypothetical protein
MYRLVRAAQLRLRPRQQTLTLLTDTRHVDISEAAVLADLLLDPETTTDSPTVSLYDRSGYDTTSSSGHRQPVRTRRGPPATIEGSPARRKT